MVKNSSGGKIAKTKARKNMNARPSLKYEELIKTEDQEYARILSINGGGRYRVICYDKVERLGICRSKINRNEMIALGGIVLVSKRDFQDAKCDILYVYNREEISTLIKYGDIEDTFVQLDEKKEDDLGVTFGNNNDNEEEEDWNDI